MDRQKKLLQLLGLIVILISVLIYYGYNHMNKKSDNTTDNNVSVTETVVPTATNIAEEDSNGNKNNTVKQSTDKPVFLNRIPPIIHHQIMIIQIQQRQMSIMMT